MANTVRPWRYLIAIACLYGIFVASETPENWRALRFIRWPIELPILVLALTLVPARAGVIRLVGILVAALAALKLINVITNLLYVRAFNVMIDPTLIATALETVAMGQGVLVAAALVLATIVVLILVYAACQWLTHTVAHAPARRASAITAMIAIVAYWPLRDVRIAWAWWPVASHESQQLVTDSITGIGESLAADRAFATDTTTTAFDAIPDEQIFARLKGKDVLIVFVEAYGRVALEDPTHAGAISAALRGFEAKLSARSLSARSAWATSPTFGGQSWLAHGTLISGLWLDNQRRYDSLFARERGTLISDFARGGWRTVAVVPEIVDPWIEAAWFGYDAIYDAAGLDYAGKPFDYMTMPDQYTLSVLARRELTDVSRPPVFAEVALISSHMPWTPLPQLVAWADIEDGQVFDSARTAAKAIEWWNRDQLKRDYTAAIDYVLGTLASFLETYGGEDLVVIVVGDHQPMNIVGDIGGGHDVPIHFIAGDPQTLDAIASWNWTDGMIPNANSPVWRMDAMRRRLIESFSVATP